MENDPFLEKMNRLRADAERMGADGRAHIMHGHDLVEQSKARVAELTQLERLYREVNGFPEATHTPPSDAAVSATRATVEKAAAVVNYLRHPAHSDIKSRNVIHNNIVETSGPTRFYGGGEAIFVNDSNGSITVQAAGDLERMSVTRQVAAVCQELMSSGDWFGTEELFERLKRRNIDLSSSQRLSQILSTTNTFSYQRGKGWGLKQHILEVLQKVRWDENMRRNAKRVAEETERNKP